MTNAVDLAQYGTISPSWRNRIINGGMTIDQRNAGAALTLSTATETFVVDRFISYKDFGTISSSRSTTAPSGFTNSLLYSVVTGGSPTSGQLNFIKHHIEAYNTADFMFGTANAKTITLSFWVRSSVTGTLSGAFGNADLSRSYPFTYTISSANTWEQKLITVAGDTNGTWLGASNGTGLRIYWDLGAGSTWRGTAGSWQSAAYIGATGAASVSATTGATFYITGVQLEAGSIATPFEFRSYGQELALCQRYYIQKSCVVTTSSIYQGVDLPVSMRATPTIGTVTFESGTGATFATAGGSALAGVDKVAWVYQSANHSNVAISTIPLSAEL